MAEKHNPSRELRFVVIGAGMAGILAGIKLLEAGMRNVCIYEKADRLEAAKTTIFGSGCKSWYLNAEGVPATWPWTYRKFEEAMSQPDLDAFEMS